MRPPDKDGARYCNDCKIYVLYVGFGAHSAICKPCMALRARKMRAEGRVIKRTAAYSRNINLRHKYGIDSDDFDRAMRNRGGRDDVGKCDICYEKKKLSVDHDHATGLLRGFLCRECNLGLANFRDSELSLMMAQQYLAIHEMVVEAAVKRSA